jgi:hypothetical protein
MQRACKQKRREASAGDEDGLGGGHGEW